MSRSKYRPKGSINGKGPRWFRNVFTNRKLRREARAAIMRDHECVLLSPANRMRPYWL